MDWILSHVKELAVAVVLTVPTFIEFSKIKLNPWSWVFKIIGRALNGDTMKELSAARREMSSLREEMSSIKEELIKHAKADDDRFAKQCRTRILRFNDEILQPGRKHTKEHYDEILDDITSYERHCELNPGYKNSKATMAIQNVEANYQKRLAEKDFL